MNQVISVLLLYIKIQQQIIVYLLGSLIGKHMARKVYDEPVNKPYRKLQVDQMPIIEYIKKLDYKKLLLEYSMEHGKQLKPVKPRKGSKNRVPNTVTCPSCGAPHHYLYDNTGGRGQYKCKVCLAVFNLKNHFSKSARRGLKKLRNVRISSSINVRMMLVLFISAIFLLCLKKRKRSLKKMPMILMFAIFTESLILSLNPLINQALLCLKLTWLRFIRLLIPWA